MITDGLSYVSVLVFFASVILAAERVTGWAVFRFVPGVVFLYIGSMLLATLGVWSMAATKPVYRELSALLTYAMIFTMLLRSDVRKIFRIGPRMLLGFFSATVTIAAGFVVAFLAMKEHLGANAWMTLGALSGSWIGGYDNIMEIQTALHIPVIDMEGAFIVDSIDYTIWVMFLFWHLPARHVHAVHILDGEHRRRSVSADSREPVFRRFDPRRHIPGDPWTHHRHAARTMDCTLAGNARLKECTLWKRREPAAGRRSAAARSRMKWRRRCSGSDAPSALQRGARRRR